VLVAHELPSLLLIFAGILYFMAIELYAGITTIENDQKMGWQTSAVYVGRRGALSISIILTTICGLIFASYDLLYFIIVIPFLGILAVSFVVKSPVFFERLYAHSFLVHSVWGFVVTFYISVFTQR
jgi:4-hydroxybenzoate polyprenyltransferase